MSEQQGDMLGMPANAESLIGRDLGDVPADKWAPLLAQMVDMIEDHFSRAGRSPEDAFAIARDAVLVTAEYFGARMIYLPSGERLRLALRDTEIFRRARAGNITQLAAEFGVTDIQIYRIIRQQRALHIAKVQGKLPL